jgi:hypothetical protein
MGRHAPVGIMSKKSDSSTVETFAQELIIGILSNSIIIIAMKILSQILPI